MLPAYVVALRVGLGLGWMFVVAAEFMGASEGLGYLLIDGQQLGKPAQILAAIVIFAILGKTTDWLIELATAPLLRWQDAFGSCSCSGCVFDCYRRLEGARCLRAGDDTTSSCGRASRCYLRNARPDARPARRC